MTTAQIVIPNNNGVQNIQREITLLRERAEREENRLLRELLRESRLRDRNTSIPDVIQFVQNLQLDEIRNLVVKGELGKYWLMIACGYHIQRTRPMGWSMGVFTRLVRDILGNINIWHRGINNEDHDHTASIRSLLFEMSPSSCQHWFKYGKKNPSGLINPICFVNRELSVKNNEFEWRKVNGIGTGRNTKEGKNNWHFVPNLDKDQWNVELYGPLPSIQNLEQAQVTRTLGDRA